jgi:hypothetical protein
MRLEVGLLACQSVASWGCDVHSFGRPSLWKPVDRMYGVNRPTDIKCLMIGFDLLEVSSRASSSFTVRAWPFFLSTLSIFLRCATTFVAWQGLKLLWLRMSLGEWLVWAATLAVGIGCFRVSMSKLKAACASATAHTNASDDASGAVATAAPPVNAGSGPGAVRRHRKGPSSSSSSSSTVAALGDRPVVDLGPYYRWHTAWHVSLPVGAAVWLAVRCASLDSEEAVTAVSAAVA